MEINLSDMLRNRAVSISVYISQYLKSHLQRAAPKGLILRDCEIFAFLQLNRP